MDKTVKWILIAVLVLVVLAFIIYLFTSRNNQPAPGPQPGPAPAPGLPNSLTTLLQGFFSSNWVKNLFGGGQAAPACNPNLPGFDNNGYYTRACGGVPGGGGANCNPDAPGNDMNGFSNSQCGG